MAKINPITKAQYVLTIQGISTYWTKCSGLKESAGVSDYNDGLNSRKIKLVGAREVQPISFTAPFDPEQHRAVVDLWSNYACEPLTATIQPVQCGAGAVPIGPTVTIYGWRLTKLEFAEADRNGSDVSEIMLEGVCERWSYE